MAAASYSILVELTNTSIHNSEADDVTALFVSASRSLKRIVVDAKRDPSLRGTDVRERIASHESFLLSFADTSSYKARLFGVPVSMSFVRTLVVTTSTICLGLFTIMRGSGIFASMESVCPTY
jgi:hypothetical protein